MTKMGFKKSFKRWRRTPTKKQLAKKAFDRKLEHCDDLWRDMIKQDCDGLCPVCTERSAFEAHHLISCGHRQHHWAPWRRENGLVVCKECHSEPAMIMDWLAINQQERHRWVQAELLKIKTGQKEYDFNLDAVEEYLNKELGRPS